MVDDVVSDNVTRLIVVVSAGVEVAVKPGEVAAGDFQPEPMAWEEVIAEIDRLKRHFVNLA